MTELGQLQRYYARFQELGIRIIAVSVDSFATNARLRRRLGAPFQFLSDPELTLIGRLGIRHKRRTREQASLAIPSQFLVDAEGVIRWIYVADTWRQRTPPGKILAAVAPHSFA